VTVLHLDDGRTLRVHDSGAGSDAIVWQHGSPQTGAPLAPVLEATAARGLRLVSYGRPSYGGSTAQPGRSVADAAHDVEQLADALGLERFATLGVSGGGPHALACGALLGERVSAVVCVGALAPYTEAFDWYAGMVAPGALRSAREGRAARAAFAETEEFDPDSFTAADWAALQSRWTSLGEDAMAAGRESADGLIDDDVAYAGPWGFEPAAVQVPVLLAHGLEDRVVPHTHADFLLRALPRAELWLRRNDGHVSVLDAIPLALDWISAVR
jgi:pimeloyl-ACP methyl ester carboxylesterase